MKLLRTMPVLLSGCVLAMGSAIQAAQTQQNQHEHEESQSSSSTSSSTQSTSSSNLSASDRRFLMKAASDGMMEVELGRLATEKGTMQNVKDVGQRMVDDHTKANDRLKQIAQQKGVSLPSDMNAKDRAEVQRMSKLSGDQFDRSYMQHMTRDHKNDLAEFQREAQSGSDPDIKEFANETIPTLSQHLHMVENMGHAGHEGMTGSTRSTSDQSTSDQADKDKDKDKEPKQ